MESLRRHGAELRFAGSAFVALARSLIAVQAERPKAILVLLVDPSTLDDPAGFVRAMKRYAPRSACWWYDPAGSPPFRAVTAQDLSRWDAAAGRPWPPEPARAQPARPDLSAEAVRTRSAREAGPKLRLTASEPAGNASCPQASSTMDVFESEGWMRLTAAPRPTASGFAETKAGREQPPPASPGPGRTMPILTDAELAMLLGDDGETMPSPIDPEGPGASGQP